MRSRFVAHHLQSILLPLSQIQWTFLFRCDRIGAVSPTPRKPSVSAYNHPLIYDKTFANANLLNECKSSYSSRSIVIERSRIAIGILSNLSLIDFYEHISCI